MNLQHLIVSWPISGDPGSRTPHSTGEVNAMARAPIRRRDRASIFLPNLDWEIPPQSNDAMLDKVRLGFKNERLIFGSADDRNTWLNWVLGEDGFNRARLFRRHQRRGTSSSNKIYARIEQRDFCLSGNLTIYLRGGANQFTADVSLELNLNIVSILANRSRRQRAIEAGLDHRLEDFDPAEFFTLDRTIDPAEQPLAQSLDGESNFLAFGEEVRPRTSDGRQATNQQRIENLLHTLIAALEEALHPRHSGYENVIASGRLPIGTMRIWEAEVFWDFTTNNPLVTAQTLGYGLLASGRHVEVTNYPNPRTIRRNSSFGIQLQFARDRRQILAVYAKRENRLRVEYRIRRDAIISTIRQAGLTNGTSLEKLNAIVQHATLQLRGRSTNREDWVWTQLGALAQLSNANINIPDLVSELCLHAFEVASENNIRAPENLVSRLLRSGGINLELDSSWSEEFLQILVQRNVLTRRRLIARESREGRRYSLTDRFMPVHLYFASRHGEPIE